MPVSGSPSERPRIAITLGDANGIGPEVILRSLSDPALREQMQPLVIGSAKVLQTHARVLGLDVPIRRVEATPEQEARGEAVLVLDIAADAAPVVQFGKVTEEAGYLAVQAIEEAVRRCLAGDADAMVTAPISKEAVHRAGFQHLGHTEFIAGQAGNPPHVMLMVSRALRVGLVSGHVPLREVAASVTAEAILAKLRVIHRSLTTDFGLAAPRIAVLGLNPHAGDGGVLGREEIDIIAPALEQAQHEGLPVEGPFPADGFFGAGRQEAYDAVLAMYHDQGLVPFKVLSFGQGVNFTAGLPLVRTSPDHGTAFDIAGRGRARPGSMKHALELAASVARHRARKIS